VVRFDWKSVLVSCSTSGRVKSVDNWLHHSNVKLSDINGWSIHLSFVEAMLLVRIYTITNKSMVTLAVVFYKNWQELILNFAAKFTE